MAHFLTRNIFVDHKYNSAIFCTLYIQALCISCTKYKRNPPSIVRVESISKYLVQIHNISGFSSRATYFNMTSLLFYCKTESFSGLVSRQTHSYAYTTSVFSFLTHRVRLLLFSIISSAINPSFD